MMTEYINILEVIIYAYRRLYIDSLFVKGDIVSDDTEIYINNFIDFLENNNMCFMGMFGE